MGKYSEDDIVRGRKVFSNGAVAGYVNTENGERFRIISGATDMSRVRNAPRIKKINTKLAKNRFDSYWNARIRAAKATGNSKKVGAVKAARTRDLKHTSKFIRDNNFYTYKNAGKYDYIGVDTAGEYVSRRSNEKQRAELAKGRAKRAEQRRLINLNRELYELD